MLLLLAVALPAAAEFAVVEETETMTVYREGDQLIVLTDGTRTLQLMKVTLSRAPDAPWITYIWDKEARRLGVKAYYRRTRLLDGELICEKVAIRPPPEHHQYVLKLIAAGPC